MPSAKQLRKRPAKSSRIGLRATPEQEAVLRHAADACHKSLTEFVTDNACEPAEQALLDQQLFMVSREKYQQFVELLDRSPEFNTGLTDLFSRPSPWN